MEIVLLIMIVAGLFLLLFLLFSLGMSKILSRFDPPSFNAKEEGKKELSETEVR